MQESRPHAAIFPSVSRAKLLFWVAFWLSVMTLIIGRAWDASWHTTQPFDGFFSPPHLFIYAMTILNIGLVEIMLFNGGLRRWFGAGFRTRLLPFEVPGALALVGGGYALLSLAGLLLDNLWHTNFGLDETMWSFPHAMLGWAWLLILLGFVACFLALQQHRPISEFTVLMLGFFVLGFSVGPVLGPFYHNNTPEMVQAVAKIPALQTLPGSVHVDQIYLHWNLTRTNPLLAPLGAFWVGAALAFLRRLDPRARIWLAAAFFWTLVTVLGDYGSAQRLNGLYPIQNFPASWLPVPLFPAALLLALLTALRLPERWAWTMSGSGFGVLVYLFWGMQPLAALLIPFAAFTMLMGGIIGTKIYTIVAAPTRRGVTLMILGTFAVSIIVGLIDLYLRFAIIS